MTCHYFKAVKQEISRRGFRIKVKMVAIKVEVVVGNQLKVEDDVGGGMIMKMMVVEGIDGGMMVMTLRREVLLMTFLTSGGETGQVMTAQGQKEDLRHGVILFWFIIYSCASCPHQSTYVMDL